MIRDFQYFTLAPLIDRSTGQHIFEGGIEAVGDASKLPALNLEYRFVYDLENEENGASEWQTYSVGNKITNTTDRWFGVQFRNTSGNFNNNGGNDYYNIKTTYDFDAGGRIMSLIKYDNQSATLPDYAFYSLFSETKIHDAHELILPDNTSSYCYQWLFYSCTSLTTAPQLPATTLAQYCYQSMFRNCSSLTTAPASLPATTLADFCYWYMFASCTSLTTSPALLATTLADKCYFSMFEGCSKLDRIVWKSTKIPISAYCGNWLKGTSASGTFEYTDPSLDIASIPRNVDGVPAGWSIILLSPKTKLLLKINNASVDSISLLGKKIASLSINGKKVKSSSAA